MGPSAPRSPPPAAGPARPIAASSPASAREGTDEGGAGAPPARGTFGFVQLELGFLLGPADGRYLIRAGERAEPEFVVVLRTLGAPRRRFLERRRRPRAVKGAEPGAVPITRASVISAEPFATASDGDDWLRGLRGDRDRMHSEVERALLQLDRLMRAHRAAAADPYARDLRPELALAVRVGHGTGEQVADGRFSSAYEVPPATKRARRIERLSPQERLAAMIGGREDVLASDELVLRARADVDARRPREAALQARIALECVLEELPAATLGNLRGELEGDRQCVSEAATAALTGEPSASLATGVEAAVRRMEKALVRHRARLD